MRYSLPSRCRLPLGWALALLLLLAGCHKNSPDPVPTTGLAGTVRVTDQNAQPLSRDGVTVTVLGTTPLLTATTNAAGEFGVGAVPAGTYALTFAKPGLSTFVLRGVAQPQAGALTRLPETYTLMQEPAIRATDLRATNIMAYSAGGSVPAVRLETTLMTPQPATYHNYVFYFSTRPDASYLTASSYLPIGQSTSAATTVSTTSRTMDRQDFLNYGFTAASGTTAYAVAYGYGQESGYHDLATGGLLAWPNPNLTPSGGVSFTMP